MSKSDIFIVQKTLNTLGGTIVGKNAHLPSADVMEVIFTAATDQDAKTLQQCSLVSVPQVAKTLATVLNKAAWCWGAEMGANERSVFAACVAISSKLQASKGDVDALLPCDLVRLALERGMTAKEAVVVVGKLVEEVGLGGPLSESNPQLKNADAGLVIADRDEAWIMEAVGKHWVAKKLTEGAVHVTNRFTIGAQFDLSSAGIAEYAKSQSLWDGNGEFDFGRAFNVNGAENGNGGQQLLNKSTANGKFTVQNMMEILRNKESKICSADGAELRAMGSIVSLLAPKESVHFFTAASNPCTVGFKPFLFDSNGAGDAVQHLLQSPKITPDPATAKPRFSSKPDRRSTFVKLHEAVVSGNHPTGKSAQQISAQLLEMEAQCIADVVDSFEKNSTIYDGVTLFRDCVEAEAKIYQH
uniref:Dipeptidase n=1 Tax=Plectus sambesii TaxID=2011161 RepID=A0A914UK51_9BILA